MFNLLIAIHLEFFNQMMGFPGESPFLSFEFQPTNQKKEFKCLQIFFGRLRKFVLETMTNINEGGQSDPYHLQHPDVSEMSLSRSVIGQLKQIVCSHWLKTI